MRESQISQVCRQEVARMRKALALMRDRKMTTSEIHNGEPVDTTDETIAVYLASIANLEPFIEIDA
jgi:hypothetical protein